MSARSGVRCAQLARARPSAATSGTAITFLVLALANQAWAASAGQRCAVSKLVAAGKYGSCRLAEEGRAVRRTELPDFETCDLRYDRRWARAEAHAAGQCPTNGDAGAMKTFVTAYADSVAVALSGGALPSCPQCGNAIVEPGEQCDQADLDGQTCGTRGFAGGTLACGPSCNFDTSACLPARFIDNHDGTITDQQTGLTWEKKVHLSQFPNFGNLHDADNYYAWDGQCSGRLEKFCQPTAAASAACGTAFGCAECGAGEGTCSYAATIWTWLVDLNAAAFAGHGDWRIPTREELSSIVDYDDPTNPPVDAAFYGANCGSSCTDLTSPLCSCTYVGGNFPSYWTASNSSGSESFAWQVVFRYGYVLQSHKTAVSYVRAVRGGF